MYQYPYRTLDLDGRGTEIAVRRSSGRMLAGLLDTNCLALLAQLVQVEGRALVLVHSIHSLIAT